MPPASNQDLPPLPSDDDIVAAIIELQAEERWHLGVSAQRIAWRLGVVPARRLGNGAVKGSWSGTMAPALRLTPRLTSLHRRGRVRRTIDTRTRDRWRYYVREEG